MNQPNKAKKWGPTQNDKKSKPFLSYYFPISPIRLKKMVLSQYTNHDHEQSTIKHDHKYFRCLLVSLHAIDIMSHLDICIITFQVYGLHDCKSGDLCTMKRKIHIVDNKIFSSLHTIQEIDSYNLCSTNHKSETHTMKRNIQIFDDKIFSSLHTFKPKKKKDKQIIVESNDLPLQNTLQIFYRFIGDQKRQDWTSPTFYLYLPSIKYQ